MQEIGLMLPHLDSSNTHILASPSATRRKAAQRCHRTYKRPPNYIVSDGEQHLKIGNMTGTRARRVLATTECHSETVRTAVEFLTDIQSRANSGQLSHRKLAYRFSRYALCLTKTSPPLLFSTSRMRVFDSSALPRACEHSTIVECPSSAPFVVLVQVSAHQCILCSTALHCTRLVLLESCLVASTFSPKASVSGTVHSTLSLAMHFVASC
ncbi:hypothetical protein K469DRAFT_334889 [Zopfia rhizophila CBS 207.26]|uniref:Uncharacterized protein n=1 Tax=Zopfia rhizophila CBS 207.26 TaxID=1314779 RepID=A0A6A6DFK3_9PEZI|nr:hypothetical protein K469DRAFT_334889 [Zopfia rhizophila CBS 207.26]